MTGSRDKGSEASSDVAIQSPPDERKLRKHEQTRARILDSAAQVFREKGYSHARLADIASLAGIHAGGIYYHFESREELVEAVLNESTLRVSELVTERLAAMPGNAGVKTRLREAIKAHLEFIHRGDNFVLAFIKIIDQVTPEIRSRHQLFEQEYGALWQGIILEGQRSGELRSELDPTFMRLLMLGALQWSLEWFHPEGRHGVDVLAEQAASIFLTGIVARDAS